MMRAEVTVYGNFDELPTVVFRADPEWTGTVEGTVQAIQRAIDHLAALRDQLQPAPEEFRAREEVREEQLEQPVPVPDVGGEREPRAEE